MSAAAADQDAALPADSAAARAGWYGKIPALGDFAQRRLPALFVDAWDEWLSGELSDAQERLDGEFGAVYDAAPTWCFALASGVIGTGWWYGTWMPSVDRVGRRFPLTIAFPGAGPLDAAVLPWGSWLAAANASRTPSCTAAEIEAALALPYSSPVPDAITAALSRLAPGSSLWWQAGDGASLPAHFGCVGLPSGAGFLDLLQATQRPLAP